ncbi:MAG: hypothetical protein V2J07_11140 [Anaerolineae bacterium]|nr:hypothetical protein [Anaerolineae bacterium]
MKTKRAVMTFVMTGFMLTMACNLLEVIGPGEFFATIDTILHTDSADPEIQILETSFPNAQEEAEPVIEFGDIAVDDNSADEDLFAACAQFEIIEGDIKTDPDKIPSAMIWANADQQAPPDGYTIAYEAFPATQEFSATARLISHEGAHVSITTSAPVRCAQVMVVGTSISPLEIYLDDALVWEGYLHRREDDTGVYHYFYIRIPVTPARPVTLNVVGYAFPPDQAGNTFAAWVPVEFFGFELP